MTTFKIQVRETLSRTVDIEAESSDDALALAEAQYDSEEIVLDSSDYDGVDYEDVTDAE